MEPESRYTLVGAAVLALAALLAAALVWLSGEDGSDHQSYMIHFEKQSLDGLQLGSDVNMRGVKVGRVQAYKLSPQNINQVDVTIRVGRDTPVSVNTWSPAWRASTWSRRARPARRGSPCRRGRTSRSFPRALRA